MNSSAVIIKAGVGTWQCAKFPIMMKICSKTQARQGYLARPVILSPLYEQIAGVYRKILLHCVQDGLVTGFPGLAGPTGERDKELLSENNKWLPERWEKFFSNRYARPHFYRKWFRIYD